MACKFGKTDCFQEPLTSSLTCDHCVMQSNYLPGSLDDKDFAKCGSALNTQEGGDHYKDLPIQPVEYIHHNNIPFCEGSVIKYVTRWRGKGGLEDLKKARHFIDLLIELESTKP